MDRGQVYCDEHGERPGYVVCLCVADDGLPALYVQAPDPGAQQPGSVLCSSPTPRHALERLVLVCDDCARARGWIPPLNT